MCMVVLVFVWLFIRSLMLFACTLVSFNVCVIDRLLLLLLVLCACLLMHFCHYVVIGVWLFACLLACSVVCLVVRVCLFVSVLV